MVLELVLVDGALVDAQTHEHGARVLDGQAVDDLAAALAADQVQQSDAEVLADAAVPAEERKQWGNNALRDSCSETSGELMLGIT